MLNIPALLEATVNTVELYAENPRLWVAQHKDKIIGLARQWGIDDFIGSLQLCCNQGSINFFFRGDAGKWRAAYRKSLKEKPVHAGANSEPRELRDERRRAPDSEILRCKDFFRKLKKKCESGELVKPKQARG